MPPINQNLNSLTQNIKKINIKLKMSSYKVQYVQIITPNYEKRKKNRVCDWQIPGSIQISLVLVLDIVDMLDKRF